MIATSHVIVGGAVGIAVGTVTKNPAAAFVAGIASHFILDSIPHLDAPFKIDFKDKAMHDPIWTRKLMIFCLLDSLIAFFLTLFIWIKYFNFFFFTPYAWGALGGYLPDLIVVVPFWYKLTKKIPVLKQLHILNDATHDLWRPKFPMPNYWLLGTISQIIFIVPCLWYILK